jgi:hypothetical protein
VPSMYCLKRKIFYWLLLALLSSTIVSCFNKKKTQVPREDLTAKKELQGIWVDDDTESPLMRVKGDTIFYADSQSDPVFFKVIKDTLYTFGSDTAAYHIEKRMNYTLWLHSMTGDQLRLHKSEDPNSDLMAFSRQARPLPVYKTQIKKDSVVVYKDIRYRAYTYINPSRKKVICSSVSEDGFQVDNTYYDNVMHICVYEGSKCIYGSDVTKQTFHSLLDDDFLNNAILSNMKFIGVSKEGFCYQATIQQPESSILSLVNLFINFDGKLSMKVVGQ